MSETTGVNVLKRAESMEVSPQFDGYSGVRIFVGTDDNGNAVIYQAGNDGGQVLEIRNPFGTQAMANNILASIQGYQYQPMSALNAQLDPAAEMGDGVTVNGVYSGIYVRATQFGRLMGADVEAPTDEEIEHEFAVETPSDRQYTRFVQQTKALLKITNLAIEAEVSARQTADTEIRATLSIQASQIQAKVNKTSPSGQTSFGWNLTDSEWTVFSGSTSNKILRAYSGGLEVKGKISATGGDIGGFTIGSTSLYTNGMSSMSSTQTTGVHVGSDGIKLGKNFKVDTSGNVQANNVKLTGTLTVGDSMITANNLRVGAQNGYDWTHSLYGSTGETYAGYALGGATGGYNYDLATNPSSGVYPAYFTTYALKLLNPSFELYGSAVSWQSTTVKNGLDQTITIYYLGRQNA